MNTAVALNNSVLELAVLVLEVLELAAAQVLDIQELPVAAYILEILAEVLDTLAGLAAAVKLHAVPVALASGRAACELPAIPAVL